MISRDYRGDDNEKNDDQADKYEYYEVIAVDHVRGKLGKTASAKYIGMKGLCSEKKTRVDRARHRRRPLSRYWFRYLGSGTFNISYKHNGFYSQCVRVSRIKEKEKNG